MVAGLNSTRSSNICSRDEPVFNGHTYAVVLFFTITPLFQTNFAPDLMHVNFLPETVDVAFNFEHFDPALTSA
jgi:hypothetical protein